MAFGTIIGLCAASMALVGIATAHGGAHQKPLVVDDNADWATRHMAGKSISYFFIQCAIANNFAEEHHIANFDPGSFFTLHDFDDNGFWDSAEILKFYGMEDESAKDVTEAKKNEVVDKIMELMDRNDNGLVEREEFMGFSNNKGVLPDFGLGPGHHWDIEMEYEIHHWEK